MVLEGSFPLYNEFFETHEHEAPAEGWTWRDSHHFTPEQEKWFLDRGCTWKKVEAGAGDVILWDSRCMHYGAAAKGDRPRIATCMSSLYLIKIELIHRRLLQTCWSYQSRILGLEEGSNEKPLVNFSRSLVIQAYWKCIPRPRGRRRDCSSQGLACFG